MSKISTRATVLLATLFASWLWSIVYAQNLADDKSRISELERTDEFNIRAALKRALDADDPEATFHWHNPHTQHSGTIVTLNPIGRGEGGQICVDLVHVYFRGESSGGRHETTLCRDGVGNWNDTRTHTASAAPSHLQLYAEQTIYDVQNALTQLNYTPGSVDGVYGGRTRRAIEEFQRDKGLPVTGNINEELLVALEQSGIAFHGKRTGPITEATDTDAPPSLTQKTADSESAGIPATDEAQGLAGEDSPVFVEAATAPAPKIEVSERTANEIAADAGMSEGVVAEGADTPGRIDESILIAATELAAADGATSLVDPATKTSILRDNPLSASEQLKTLANMAESFHSHWFFIAGFAVCCLVGAFASWFFTPRVNHITLPETPLEPDEDELKAKIALVTRRLDHASSPPTDWSYDEFKHHGPPLVRKTENLEQPVDTLELQLSEAASPTPKETDAVQAPADKVAVSDTRMQARLEKVVPKIEKSVEQPTAQTTPTPSQDATETIKQADEFIDIIEAIKEAEDLIKEAQQILKHNPIESASKDHITNSIKQATELIKEALSTGPIEGGSSKEITKALKNASLLIKQSLTKDPVENTLRAT